MSRRGKYPYWVFPSHRAFKAKKRRDLAALSRALDQVNLGSAWLPFYAELEEMRERVKVWRKALSVKEWGR